MEDMSRAHGRRVEDHIWQEAIRERLDAILQTQDLIVKAQDTTNNHLDALGWRVSRTEKKIDTLDDRLVKGEERFTGIESKLSKYENDKAFTRGALSVPQVALKLFQGKGAILTAVAAVGAVTGYVGGFFSSLLTIVGL